MLHKCMYIYFKWCVCSKSCSVTKHNRSKASSHKLLLEKNKHYIAYTFYRFRKDYSRVRDHLIVNGEYSGINSNITPHNTCYGHLKSHAAPDQDIFCFKNFTRAPFPPCPLLRGINTRYPPIELPPLFLSSLLQISCFPRRHQNKAP